jgi:beta-1,4-mannosyltransferase
MPGWTSGNPYLSQLRDCLEQQGVEVKFRDIPGGMFPISRIALTEKSAGIIHLHWISDLIAPAVWSGSRWKVYVKAALLYADVMLARAMGRRVVWTIHNLVSHESSNGESELIARRFLARAASRVILHSASALAMVERVYGVAIRSKASVVRHGNYSASYAMDADRATALRTRFEIADNETVILFLGALRPYKGVERLIRAVRAAPPHRRLKCIIAGKPMAAEYARTLQALAEGSDRVRLALGFVDENDVAALHELADAVVIPFERTLTSGSAVLAMTMGKALILPSEASVLDLIDERGGYYFGSDEGLVEILSSLDRSALKKMGRHNRQVAAEFSWQTVGELTAKAYGAGDR